MSKAKIRSMQRGAQKRDRGPPLNLHELYKKHPPRLAKADKPHLDFRRFGKLENVDRIKIVVLAAQKNGIGTASEISSLLNKLLITTAIGEKWTPRLVWFATSAIRAEHSSAAEAKRLSNRSHNDAKFCDFVNRAIGSRLDEIQNEFDRTKPNLGDAYPELANLKKKLEKK